MSDESVLKQQARSREATLPALALIATGVFFFVARLAHINVWAVTWPVLVLLPGLLLLWPAHQATAEKRQGLAFLGVPGMAVTVLAMMLFINNLTGYWRSWAYLWPLLPAALVFGLMYVRRFDRESRVHENGTRLVRGLVLLTMALAIFFELMVFRGLGGYWPLWLVAAGGYLLIKQRR